jgi:uncharacterized protein
MNPSQRVSFIILGVSDLAASREFYKKKSGWQVIDNESEELVADACIVQNGGGFKRFTLAINCFSEKRRG